MLSEMRYIENELIPMLRERAKKHEISAQKQLSQWRHTPGVMSLLLSVNDVPEAAPLPDYNYLEIHEDPEKMFVSQLKWALATAFAEGDAVPSVRANVGCACACTQLGGLCQMHFADKMPWLRERLTEEQIREMTAEDLTDSPEFLRGLSDMKMMKELLAGTGIEVYPMDLQGPVDMAHLLRGDEFFYDLYDDPELAEKTLELALAADIRFMERCFEVIGNDAYTAHYNALVLPGETPLKISEDTSTLLSLPHLKRFMVPYTERLLARFGGGYIHYCGNNSGLYDLIPKLKGNIGLNFGNPERHDPAETFRMLGEAGMCFYGPWPNLSPENAVRMAAREDGTFNYLMPMSVPQKDEARVLENFREAVEKTRGM